MVSWHILNERLPTLQVLRQLRLECRRIEADYWRGRCPYHPSSGRPSRSLAVNIAKRKWYCHNCRKYGDLIDLWAHVRGITPADAARDLEREFVL